LIPQRITDQNEEDTKIEGAAKQLLPSQPPE
jgi:hypothetical protein